MTIWTIGLMFVAFLGDGVSVEFIPSGITRLVGGYRPIRAELKEDASIVKQAPEGLEAPKYGKLEVGDKSWIVIVDEPEDKPAKLYVDTNGDGNLTNDPETKWSGRKNGDLTMYSGEASVDLGNNEIGQLGLYRFDPKDKARAQLKDTLLFYTDYGFEYTLTLDGNEFKTSSSGTLAADQSFWIDRDKNGQPSRRFEMATIDEPFNFTGTTFVLKIKDNTLALEKAEKELPMMPLPPDLQIGKSALTFEAVALDGSKISFPKSYEGKIVMLDFWATWCGPCIGEIPNMKQAYEDWHDKGFEILGISFDQEGMEEKLKDFLAEKELPWTQVYEGKGWDTTIGLQHDVSAIPFVLLVDGDSGAILATAAQLRGPKLTNFVGEAIEKKASQTAKE